MLIVAAATEADIAELDEYEERQMFLEEIGLKESGVARLIKRPINCWICRRSSRPVPTRAVPGLSAGA